MFMTLAPGHHKQTVASFVLLASSATVMVKVRMPFNRTISGSSLSMILTTTKVASLEFVGFDSNWMRPSETASPLKWRKLDHGAP